MFLRIGILYEGKYDCEPIKIIIQRSFSDVSHRIKKMEFVFYQAEGPIIDKIEPAMFNFFKVKQCQIGVYVGDSDNDPKKCREIHKKIQDISNKLKVTEPAIIGCPKPHFEAWFTTEEDALKKALGIKSTSVLEFVGLDPKTCVENLYKKYAPLNKEMTYGKEDLYIEVAENLNLSKLAHNKSFNNFFREIHTGLNQLKLI